VAALVDAAVFVGGMAGFVGLGIAGAVAYARVRGDEEAKEGGNEDEEDGGDKDERSDIHGTAARFVNRRGCELCCGARQQVSLSRAGGGAWAFGWSVFVGSMLRPVGSSAFAALSSECCPTGVRSGSETTL
jgi:hypothetical protein